MNYFTPQELKCRCGECDSVGKEMDKNFILALQALRETCNFPFIVTSAYRCPKHNSKVSKGKYGAHTLGKAIDIEVTGQNTIKLIKVFYTLSDFFTGLGISQKGESRFIHVDTVKGDKKIPRPAIWTY